jgi:hypothetical protein
VLPGIIDVSASNVVGKGILQNPLDSCTYIHPADSDKNGFMAAE